ncbi:hypothetical protein B0O80DRAFT_482712 [Mortierella sp. GBAus27b]|nr:hypothetical protein B0O80DRAFT_482712 [Mortierella sp. GBAus27b]
MSYICARGDGAYEVVKFTRVRTVTPDLQFFIPHHIASFFPSMSCLSRSTMSHPAENRGATLKAVHDNASLSVLERKDVGMVLKQVTQPTEQKEKQESSKYLFTTTPDIMALARKSIMLNASASPESIFRDVTYSSAKITSSIACPDMSMRLPRTQDKQEFSCKPIEPNAESMGPCFQGVLDLSQPCQTAGNQPRFVDNGPPVELHKDPFIEPDPRQDNGSETQLLSATDLSFDLRSALRQDAARVKYQLPNLTASLSPPTSPGHRHSPYSVPLVHERETLRTRRTRRVESLCFKARPLNPKVFTSAGDLGVPRIIKKPSTIPVSPTFSTMRARRIKDEATTGLRGQPATKRQSNTSKRQQDQSMGDHEARGVSRENSTEKPMDGTLMAKLRHQSQRTFDVRPHLATHLRAIAGPPRRPGHISSTRGAVQEDGGYDVGKTAKLGPRNTRPVPFRFATDELQRKREAGIMFSPVPRPAPEAQSPTALMSSTDPISLEDLA